MSSDTAEIALGVAAIHSVIWGSYLLYGSYRRRKDLRTINQTYIDITTKFGSMDSFTQRTMEGDREATEKIQKVISLTESLYLRDFENNEGLRELRRAVINAKM